MSLALRRLFRTSGASRDSADASVVTHIVHGDVIHDDRLVVDIPHVPHVVYGSVVEKGSAIPISSLIANTNIAKTVVDAAIESNIRPPVALMKNISVIAPAPITRGPEETRLGH
jgi:hypothetical protein